MIPSGLPELTSIQDLKYVRDALQPQTTDAEATIFFTRLIESSLGSIAKSLISSFITLLSYVFLAFLLMMSPSFHSHRKHTPLDKMAGSRKSLFSHIIRNTTQINTIFMWFEF